MKDTVLQFSGGRDSLALLLHMRPLWADLTVVYVSTRDEYPETRKLIEKVRGLVPDFIEIKGDVWSVREKFGSPSDLVPASGVWQQVYENPSIVDRHTCCYLSHMQPLQAAMIDNGVKFIIRGQRLTDSPKSPVKHGEQIGGVQIFYPIETWTDAQVSEKIQEEGFDIPPYYEYGATSAPDCLHCTAWLEHNAFPYLREKHPEVAKKVQVELRKIKIVWEKQLDNVNRILGA